MQSRNLLLFFLSCSQLLFSAIDLGTKSNDTILETKKITISEYPNAFNPSIVRWKGEIWMSFRFFPDIKNLWVSRLGLIKLNDNFEILGKPFILNCLDCDEFNQQNGHSLEDGRLITCQNKLYIIYNDHVEPMDPLQRRVVMAEIDLDGEEFLIQNRDYFLKFEGEDPNKIEKNWVPFVHSDQLYLAYTLNPHRILIPRSGLNICDTLTSTKQRIPWRWGELRGGTPALLVDNEYLAIFHSVKEMWSVQSKREKILHYFMGAYTFSCEYPFTITKIAPEPLFKSDFYQEPHSPYWFPKLVIFPCGYIFDETYIWVAYGRADLECWIAKIDRKKLLNSLVPLVNH